jgi:transcriptional regulator with XRE-family HTH domain
MGTINPRVMRFGLACGKRHDAMPHFFKTRVAGRQSQSRPEPARGLAYEADLNRSYMSTLERGATYPGLEIIVKLACVLGVEPAELLRLPAKRRARGR